MKESKDKDKHIFELVANHGKRAQPNAEMMEKARANVKAHWQNSIKQNATTAGKANYRKYFSLAASVLVFVTVGFFISKNINTNKVDHLIESSLIRGELMVSTDKNNWTLLDKNQNIESVINSHWIKTNEDSFASIVFSDQSELRINQNTILKVDGLENIQLASGEVYFDADNAIQSHMKINTDFGSITHIGTRYAVKVKNNELQVAVRNGKVNLEKNNDQQIIDGGNKISMSSSGAITKSTIQRHDPSWNWATKASQPFEGQNKTLHDYIVWFAHENGYEVDWNNNESGTSLVRLSGKLPNVDSIQQISAVFTTTKYNYKIDDGLLRIF